MLNQEQFKNLLTSLVPAVTAYAVGKGWIPVGQAADVGAGVVALGGAVYAWAAHTNAAKVASAAAVPGVDKVVIASNAESSVRSVAQDPSLPNVVKNGQ